jgi:hypothetical protein
MRLRDVFTRQPDSEPRCSTSPSFDEAERESLDDPTLKHIEQDRGRLHALWDGLADRRDPAATSQRNAIAAELAALEAAQAHRLREQSQINDRRALVEGLTLVHSRIVAELIDASRKLIATATPDASDIAHLYLLGRQAETIRAALHDATQEPEFARRTDALGHVAFAWHEQHRARMRMLDRVRNKHVRPRLLPQPWEAQVSRLREHIKSWKE